MFPIEIERTGLYLPERAETAAELAPRLGRSERWILSRTGVRERRISDLPVERMAARAARLALGDGPAPDLVLNASTTPRQLIPDTAAFILGELGWSGVPGWTVHATCLSFLAGLQSAASLVTSGAFSRILVVSAEKGSVARDFSEPESAALLGDGAAAAVVRRAPEGSGSALLAFRYATWPEGAHLAEFRGAGTHRHPNDPATVPEDNLFHMNGPRIYKMARKRVTGVVRAVLEDAGLRQEDVSLVVPHQASGPALQAIPRYGFRPEQVVDKVAEWGNCIAASMPMALAWAHAEGRLRRGDIVLMLGTGAGLSVGAAVLRW